MKKVAFLLAKDFEDSEMQNLNMQLKLRDRVHLLTSQLSFGKR